MLAAPVPLLIYYDHTCDVKLDLNLTQSKLQIKRKDAAGDCVWTQVNLYAAINVSSCHLIPARLHFNVILSIKHATVVGKDKQKKIWKYGRSHVHVPLVFLANFKSPVGFEVSVTQRSTDRLGGQC